MLMFFNAQKSPGNLDTHKNSEAVLQNLIRFLLLTFTPALGGVGGVMFMECHLGEAEAA